MVPPTMTDSLSGLTAIVPAAGSNEMADFDMNDFL